VEIAQLLQPGEDGMAGNTKMAEQLATSKIGKQATLYTAAIDCIQQCSNVQQAARLLAKKFIDANPWAEELLGRVHIEQRALAYVQRRYHEMRSGAGHRIDAKQGQSMTSGTASQSKWTRNDIMSDGLDDRDGVGQREFARGQKVIANSVSDTIGHNSGDRTAFSAKRMLRAQASIKDGVADSILQTLKFSDGRLAASLPLRELRCYQNDGTLAKVLLDKINLKFRNPDINKTITEYLNENEIKICAEEAREIKLAEAS
jgi:hypothetical protein